MEEFPHSLYESGFFLTLFRKFELTFQEQRYAEIVRDATMVEKELRPHLIQRSASIKDNSLILIWHAKDLRTLRVASGSFLQLASLSIETIEAFKIH